MAGVGKSQRGGAAGRLLTTSTDCWYIADVTLPRSNSLDESRPLLVVVDDEPVLRTFMGRVLHAHYRVLLAADGAEALDLVRMDGLKVSAVVTDVRMPGMDGLALAAALRDLGLAVPILFVSGFTVVGHAPGPFLPKPFAPDDLLAAVQQLLGANQGPQPV